MTKSNFKEDSLADAGDLCQRWSLIESTYAPDIQEQLEVVADAVKHVQMAVAAIQGIALFSQRILGQSRDDTGQDQADSSLDS